MIILSVLKIIAIVILILFSLVLLIAVLLLFAPFRYKTDISFVNERLDGTASVVWLLSLIKVNAEYHKGKEPELYVMLFGKKIYDIMNDNISKKDSKEKVKDIKEKAESDRVEIAKNCTEETCSMSLQEESAEKQSEKIIDYDRLKPEKGKCGTEYEKRKKISLSMRIRAKLKALYNRIYKCIRNTLLRLYEAIKAVYGAIKDKSDKLKALYRLYHEEKYSGAVTLFKHCIAGIYTELRPRHGKGRIIYGSTDPYSTGTAMELAAVLYPAYCSFLEIIPDFEKAELEAGLKFKGRIRLFFIGIPILRIYINKDLKAMYLKSRKILELD